VAARVDLVPSDSRGWSTLCTSVRHRVESSGQHGAPPRCTSRHRRRCTSHPVPVLSPSLMTVCHPPHLARRAQGAPPFASYRYTPRTRPLTSHSTHRSKCSARPSQRQQRCATPPALVPVPRPMLTRLCGDHCRTSWRCARAASTTGASSTGAPLPLLLILSPGFPRPALLADPHLCLYRNIKGFMIQTGDPTGTGKGGQSIWGRPFPDEVRGTLKVRSPCSLDVVLRPTALSKLEVLYQPADSGSLRAVQPARHRRHGQLGARYQQVRDLDGLDIFHDCTFMQEPLVFDS